MIIQSGLPAGVKTKQANIWEKKIRKSALTELNLPILKYLIVFLAPFSLTVNIVFHISVVFVLLLASYQYLFLNGNCNIKLVSHKHQEPFLSICCFVCLFFFIGDRITAQLLCGIIN